MNVTLRQLRVFLAVVRHASFSRAAEQAGASQSAVSLAIQQLEAELGVKLLDRTTRQVRPTAIGQTLIANASRLVGELETMLEELRGIGEQRRGRVALACVPSVARALMPRCVGYCTTQWPGISFTIEDVAAREVLAKVVRGDVEFGVSSGDIAGSELHVESLMEDPFLLVCRRDDAFAERPSVRWSMLAERRLVMLNNTSGSRQQILDTLAKTGARSEIFLDLAQPTSVLAMVEAGLGIAVVPQMVTHHSSHPLLVTRKLVAPTVRRTILLLRRRDRSLSPAAASVWGALRHLFAADGPDPRLAGTGRDRVSVSAMPLASTADRITMPERAHTPRSEDMS